MPSLSGTSHKEHDPTSQDTEQGKATSGLDLDGGAGYGDGSRHALRHRLVFSPTLHLCLKRNVSTKGNFSKSLIKASDKEAGSLSVSVKRLRKLKDLLSDG